MSRALPALFKQSAPIRPSFLFPSFLVSCLIFWGSFAAVAGTPGLLRGPWTLESMGLLKKVEFIVYGVSVAGIPVLSLLLAAIASIFFPARAPAVVAPSDSAQAPGRCRKIFLYGVVPVAFYFLSMLPHLDGPVDPMDEGVRLAAANQFQHGARPYRDIYFQYGPGIEIFQPWTASYLFGNSLAANRQLDRFLSPLGNVAVYFFTLLALQGSSLALLLPLLFLGNGNFWVPVRSALPLTALACLVVGGKRNHLLAGVLCGVGMFYSLEGGTLIAPAVILTYGLLAARERITGGENTRVWLRDAVYFAGGFAAVLIVALIPLITTQAVVDFLKNSFLVGSTLLERWGKPTPPISPVFREWIQHPFLIFQSGGSWQRWWFPPLLYVGVLTWGLWRGSKKLLLLSIAGLFFFVIALGRTDYDHWLKGTIFLWPVVLTLIYQGLKQRTGWVLTVFLSAYLIWHMNPHSLMTQVSAWSWPRWTLPAQTEQAQGLERVGPVNIGTEQAELIAGTVQRIHRLAPPGARFYVYSNDPVYYYMADVVNPTRFALVSYAVGDAMVEEVVADLEKNQPAGVLARFDHNGMASYSFHARITEYIQRNYSVVDKFGPFIFLERIKKPA